MTELLRTKGEILFEQYLNSQSLPFEFEKKHAGKNKRPDYTIEWEDETVVFEVKDFDPPERFPTGVGAFDPYTGIREKIGKGRIKFKEYKEFCCGLVLHNTEQPFVSLHEPNTMLGAMYGDSGFTFPVNMNTGDGDTSQLKRAFLGRGKMLRPNWEQGSNTTISAMITVSSIKPHFLRLLDLVRENPRRDNETLIRNQMPDFDSDFEVPRVIVWHNAVARVPFPKHLFRGRYDTHFGTVAIENGEAVQGVTYEGSAVPDRIRLSKPREEAAS